MSDARFSTGMAVAIVDDEPLARENLRLLLHRHADITIAGEAERIDQAQELIERTQPDLVFLDIKMPHGDGFEVLAKLDLETSPFVIFVTAFDEFALRAFGARAIDYLLKPFDDARFEAVLANARDRVAERRAAQLGDRLQLLFDERGRSIRRPRSDTRTADRLLVKERERAFFVPLREIAWIEADGPYVRLHTNAGAHLMRASISTLARDLDPERFVRIHRGAIVNLDFVREFQPYFHGDYVVVLTTGTRLRMSRRRRDALERFWGKAPPPFPA